MTLRITTLAERPELSDAIVEVGGSWPEFMTHDVVSDAYWSQLRVVFREFALVGTYRGEVVARGYSVPFALRVEGRGELPADGWDRVLIWAFADHRLGVVPDTVSAIEILVDPAYQGRRFSGLMLAAMRDNVRRLGFSELVAPVRPNAKHHEPRSAMREYAFRTRDDGLPVDPWLRTHVRAGGEIVKVAPTSMTIAGTLAEWRKWTDLPFDADGPLEVPDALVPVQVNTVHDHAVYVEPNVWVRHLL